MLCLDDLVAQSRTVRDEYFEFLLALLLLLSEHLFVGVQTGFPLCLAGFRSHVRPFQFAFQGLTAF